MPKIEIRESKTLKLINVLSQKLSSVIIQEKQIAMMDNWISAHKLKSVGPLIIYSTGVTDIDSDGNPIMENTAMMQIDKIPEKIENFYDFKECFRIEHCLFARFEGEPYNLQYAHNKLTLYAYENDLDLTGEYYMVFVSDTVNNIIADIFMPVKQNE